jgi:hypothetical protein
LSYGSGAGASHLTKLVLVSRPGRYVALWRFTADKNAPATNLGFITRCDKIKQSIDVHFYGRLPSDLCNVPTFLLPGVNLQIELTKARSSFYLMNATEDSKTT